MPINEDHPILPAPKTNISLWRYMDIPSFLSLLIDEALTFTRSDLFEDKYEGTLPKLTAAMIDAGTKIQIEEGKLNPIYGTTSMSQRLNKSNREVFLNCWCNERHEMVHMWKIYSKEHGVAIETEYERLKQAILSSEQIYPSLIKYIDYDADLIDWMSNGLTVFTLKRKEYKNESEFRLILPFPRAIEDELLNIENTDKRSIARELHYLNTPVIKCKVNLNVLIKKIHISPYAPKWYLPLISNISIKYGLDFEPILQSDL
jgi:hypothetical protein